MTTTTIEEAIYRLKVEGLDKPAAAANALDQLAAAEGRVEVKQEKRTRATLAGVSGFDRLLASVDRQVAAEQRLQRQLEAVARFEDAGVGSAQQRSQAIAGIISRYENDVKRIGRGAAEATGLTTQQLANMQFQLQDIGVGLASGQSPFMVIAQQGSQIVQSLSGQGGVLGALRAVGTGIVSFVTNPLNVALIGLAAAAALLPKIVNWWRGTEEATIDVNAVTKESAELVDKISAAYDKAKDAAAGYFDVATSKSRLALLTQTEDQRRALDAALANFNAVFAAGDQFALQMERNLSLLAGAENSLSAIRNPLFDTLRFELRNFLEDLEAGREVDLPKFAEAVSAIGEDPRAAGGLRQVAQAVVELLQPGIDAEVALERLEAELRVLNGTATEADRVLLGMADAADALTRALDAARARAGEFRNAIADLAKIALPDLSDREVALERYRKALSEAVSPGQLHAAEEAYLAALDRIGIKEALEEQEKAAKAAKSALKDYDQELSRIRGSADSLIDKLFPEEGAKRRIAELQAQLDKFGDALDPLQRKAIEMQIELLVEGKTVDQWLEENKSVGERLQDTFKALRKDAESFVGALVDGLMRGDSLLDTLNKGLASLSQRLASRALQDLFSGNLIGAAINGIGALISRLLGRITERLKEIEDLRNSIDARMNDATGHGYRNEVADIVEQHRKDAETARRSGDPDLIRREQDLFDAAIRHFLDGADLTVRQLDDLARAFPDLADVIGEFRQKAIDDFVDDLNRRFNQATGQGYLNDLADLKTKLDEDLKTIFQDLGVTQAQSYGDTFAGLTDKRNIAAGGGIVPPDGSLEEKARRIFEDSARSVIEGANLSVAALEKLAKAFPELADVIDEVEQQMGRELTVSLRERLNAASGRGYVNDVRALIEERNQNLRDADILGVDRDLIRNTFGAEARQLLEGANLSARALESLRRQFPALTSVVRDLEAAMGRELTVSLRERLNEATGKGYLNDIRALIEERNRNLADAPVLGVDPDLIRNTFAAEVQAIVDQLGLTGDGFGALIRQFPTLAGVIHESTRALEEFRDSIRDWLDQVKVGDLSPLSPLAQLQEAQRQFDTQLALAQGGDETARSGLTQVADRLLQEARSYFASSPEYAAIYETVIAALGGLAQLPGFAAGGWVGGGVPGRDSVPAMLMPGEYVTPAWLARQGLFGPAGNDNRPLPDNGPHFERLMRVIADGTNAQIRESRESRAEFARKIDDLERRLRVDGSRDPRTLPRRVG